MSAGDELLEKIDQEKNDYLSTRASEESKMVEHCIHNIGYDVFVSYTFSFYLALYCQYC